MSDDGPDPDAWLVTFGDLITLLLTFFVLLLSMSSMDKQRVEAAFTYFTGKPFVLKGGETASIGPPSKDKTTALGQIRRGMELARLIQGVLATKEKVDSEGRVLPEERLLDSKGEVRVKGDARGQIIVFSGTFLFPPGGAVIKVSALPVLDSIGKALRNGKEDISIEGHTDNQESASDPRYRDRWDLSAARAVNVLKYLTQQGKIAQKRMAAVGYGDTRPLAKEKGKKSSRDRDRRVEIIVAQAGR